jgi:hypothetical protein
MKAIKLTLKEINDLQPTRVAMVQEHRTVVGGIEFPFSENWDSSEPDSSVKKLFGDDCAAWECEPDEGDGCCHVVVYAKL